MPLLSLLQTEPLRLQAAHLSFQEYFAACAIREGLSGSRPWQWDSWWTNTVMMGSEMGVGFGEGLVRAAGVQGDSLDLSRSLGGDRPTVYAVLALVIGSAVKSIDLTGNDLGPDASEAIARGIATTRRLKEITLASNNLTRDGRDLSGIAAIAAAIKSGSVTSADFSDNRLGPRGAAELVRAGAFQGCLAKVDLSGNRLGRGGCEAIAGAIAGSNSLTSVSLTRSELNADAARTLKEALTGSHILQELTLLRNAFDVATALELAEASKQHEISLCGLAADDTEADFSGQGLNLADTVLIAAALQFRNGLTEANLSSNALGLEGARALVQGGAFSGALTKCHLRDNALGVEGWTIILEALCDQPDSKITEWDITGEGLGPAVAAPLAKYLTSTSAIGRLIECKLRGNELGVEGWTVVLQALCSRPDSMIRKWDLSGERLSHTITRALADYLAVSGNLREVTLLGSGFDVDTAAMLNSIAKKRGISLCGIAPRQSAADFNDQRLQPADAVLIAAALEARSSLTQVDLARNCLCGVWTAWEGRRGVYTAAGIGAIAEACARSSLTSMDLSGNELRRRGGEALASGIAASSTLTSLSLAANGLDADVAKALGPAIGKSKSLQKLDLADNQLTNYGEDLEGITAIAAALACGSVTLIDLSNNFLKMEGTKALVKGGAFKGALQSVSLARNGLSVQAAKVLGRAIATSNALTLCDLRENWLGDDGRLILEYALRAEHKDPEKFELPL